MSVIGIFRQQRNYLPLTADGRQRKNEVTEGDETMKLLSIFFFAGGTVFLILTVTQVLRRGWGPLDVQLLDVYFVILPQYLLLIAGVLLIAGFVSAFAPHP